MRAIVTGGASGIGAAVVSLLREKDWKVVVLDRDPADIQVDVADSEGVARAVAEAVERLGGLDLVVNNAGIGAQGTVEENSDEEWQRVWEVNVMGMVRVARAALPHLRKSDRAAIVNTCSVAATAGLPNRALYSATKGAVLSLTLAMAADHVREGIRVNCVPPGARAPASPAPRRAPRPRRGRAACWPPPTTRRRSARRWRRASRSGGS